MNVNPLEIIIAVVSAIALVMAVVVWRMLSTLQGKYQGEIDSLKSQLQRADADKEITRRAITGEFKQLLNDQRSITAVGASEEIGTLVKGINEKISALENQNLQRLTELENQHSKLPDAESLNQIRSSLEKELEQLKVQQASIQNELKTLEQKQSSFSGLADSLPEQVSEHATKAVSQFTAENKASTDALCTLFQQLQDFVKGEALKTQADINELAAKNEMSVKSATLDKFLMLMDSDEERKAAALSFVRQIASEDLFAELAIKFPSTIAVAALEQMAKKSDRKDVFVAALGNLATQKLDADMYDDARALYMQAIDIIQESENQDQAQLLPIYAKLARLCRLQTDFDYAKVIFKRVVDAQRTASPELRQEAIQALLELAQLYEMSNFSNRLEEVYKRLHENYIAIGQLDRMDAARNLRRLADLYLAEERYEEAEPAYHRALPTYSKAAEAEDPELIAVLRNLAKTYFHLNQLDKSESLLTQLINGLVKAKANNEEVLLAVSQLEDTAQAFVDRDSFHRAETIFEKCANALKQILPNNDERVLSLYEKLESLAKRAEDKEHLKKFYRDQIDSQKNGASKTAKYVNCALKLATLHAADGNFMEAESIYKSIENSKSHDTETADLLDELAKACSSQAKYDLAQKTYERALALKETVLGPNSPELINSCANLGASYSVQKEYKKAEEMFKRELMLTEKNFGFDNEKTITALMHLAGCYIISGQIDEAEPCYKRILETRYKTLGEEHSDIIVSLLHLAELYRIQKNFSEAEIFYESACEMAENMYGKESLQVAEILEKQANLARQDDQAEKAGELAERASKIRGQSSEEAVAKPLAGDTARAEI
ncbi:MAG TPA: tetratricopeptide repeat protein [Drouetiella sp.]|jgi:Tetratricopeptide repeat